MRKAITRHRAVVVLLVLYLAGGAKARGDSTGTRQPIPEPPVSGIPCTATLVSETPITPQAILRSPRGVGAEFVASARISRAGLVEGVTIKKSSHPSIDAILVAALKERRYRPARLPDGRILPCPVTFTIVIIPKEWVKMGRLRSARATARITRPN